MTDEQNQNASGASRFSVGLGVNEHRKAMIEFDRMSGPLLRERCKIVSAIKRAYVMKPCSPTEIVELPTPAQIELLRQMDEILEYMHKICFIPNSY